MIRLTVGQLRAELDGIHDDTQVFVVKPEAMHAYESYDIVAVVRSGAALRIEVEAPPYPYPCHHDDDCGCEFGP